MLSLIGNFAPLFYNILMKEPLFLRFLCYNADNLKNCEDLSWQKRKRARRRLVRKQQPKK